MKQNPNKIKQKKYPRQIKNPLKPKKTNKKKPKTKSKISVANLELVTLIMEIESFVPLTRSFHVDLTFTRNMAPNCHHGELAVKY